jgi:hypothetical protein
MNRRSLLASAVDRGFADPRFGKALEALAKIDPAAAGAAADFATRRSGAFAHLITVDWPSVRQGLGARRGQQ